MPELPEVDRFVDIVKMYMGWRIIDVSVHRGESYLPGSEQNELVGAVFHEVFRRGKFMVWNTSVGIMVCHNAMSGYWDSLEEPWTFDYVEGKRSATEKDVRVEFVLCPPTSWHSNETRTLRFHDARMFGSLRLYTGPVSTSDIRSLQIGPEATTTKNKLPSAPVMSVDEFTKKLARSSLPIKAFLLDQNKIAGLGNIYAAEALYFAKIHPDRPANQLTVKEAQDLHFTCDAVLRLAIARELNYNGLSVYRRKTCGGCKSDIQKIDIKGRSTYFCPKCQEKR